MPAKPKASPAKKGGGLFDDDEVDDFPVRRVSKPTAPKAKGNLFGDDDDDFPVVTKNKPKNKKKLFDDSD